MDFWTSARFQPPKRHSVIRGPTTICRYEVAEDTQFPAEGWAVVLEDDVALHPILNTAKLKEVVQMTLKMASTRPCRGRQNIVLVGAGRGLIRCTRLFLAVLGHQLEASRCQLPTSGFI